MSLITENFEGQVICIRPSDEYWNLTQMCKIYNKRINNFLRIDSTEAFLKSTAYRLNKQLVEKSATEEIIYVSRVPSDAPFGVAELIEKSATLKELVEIDKGGVPEQQGTWGHKRVALKLAAWLNSDFEAWVYEVIEKLLTQGSVKLEDEIASLKEALGATNEIVHALECEYTLLEYRNDQLKYENDELSELAQWRQTNSWTGRDH
jgi:hypothetical protein